MSSITIQPATFEHNGTTYELRAAVIKDTMLGYEDHGIFTFVLNLDYGGSGQGAGLHGLDDWDKEQGKRVATANGLALIIETMNVIGVSAWEYLPGKNVYAICEKNYGLVRGLANITTPETHNIFFAEVLTR